MIRPLTPADTGALADMLARCSPLTRYRRFHGVVHEIPAAYLHRCLYGDQEARIAVQAGRIVGFASAGPAAGAPHVHEVGVLVEDRWQGGGLGRALVTALFAERPAVTVVRMDVCQPSLLAYLLARLPVLSTTRDGCDTTVDVDARVFSSTVPSPTAAPAPPRQWSAARGRDAAVPT